VALITETNVPHADNVAYFGDGYHEAQMVYNFALPPLTLHTFQTGSAAALARWAGGLSVPSPRAAFFNFLASHDGIGLNPARGLLSDTEVDALEERTRQRGGFVSYKDNPDGTRSAYELNINYWDALCDPEADEPLDVQVDRFVGAQAVMLALAGVPGIYFHSLFGLRGWPEGVRQTGQNRTINRRKCHRAELEEDLALAGSRPARVYTRYRALLQARCAHAAFHPQGAMRVWQGNESVLAIVRLAPGGGEQVICLQEVSGRGQAIGEALDELLTAQAAAAREAGRDQPSPAGRPAASWRDLITGTRYDAPGPVSLAPYQTLWLVAGR
jgi:sucrose phosphorylase